MEKNEFEIIQVIPDNPNPDKFDDLHHKVVAEVMRNMNVMRDRLLFSAMEKLHITLLEAPERLEFREYIRQTDGKDFCVVWDKVTESEVSGRLYYPRWELPRGE